MALSLKLGKLDAICAKLKSVTKDTPVSPKTPNGNAVATTLPEVLESNNNSQKALDYNESLPIKPVTPSTPVIQPTPLLASTPETSKIQHAATPKSSKSGGRKKSRKSTCPRNLAHYEDGQGLPVEEDDKDELAAYQINNQNVNFPLQDEETGDTEDFAYPDSSRATSPGELDSYSLVDSLGDNEDSMCEDQSQLDSSSFASSGFPLDLSVSRNADDVSVNGSPRSGVSDHEVMCQSESAHQSLDCTADSVTSAPQDASSGKQAASAEDRVLQDYANNTMNELLSIYGLGSGDSVAKQVPLTGLSLYPQKSPSTSDPSHRTSSLSSKLFPAPASVKPNVPVNGKSPTAGKGIYANLSYPKLAQVNGGHLHGTPTPSLHSSIPVFKPIAPSIKLGSNLSSVTGLHSGVKVLSSNKGNVGGEFSKFRLTPSGHKLSHSSSSSGKAFNPDYTKYLKRFHNGEECGGSHCRDLGYREHYHCLDCSFKVFVKKEEMVRHFKWHKKRDDSLQHGFLRFSPMDDCSLKFGTCTHNGRQTHYHCLQQGCDKVYISTSDVQMHANYHRKDSAIIMEGFQRFRATEDCGTPSCHFYGQRTTHFHCRRTSCKFTFKNKADMEKHKTYHQKDEILGRDGFKKFMKYEHCSYKGCRFSKISNHIHCIRDGCNYVLHSTAQLYSHKRKHERRDFENAYRNFRQGQKPPAQQPRPSQHVISALQGVNPLASPAASGTKMLTPISLAALQPNVPSMSLPVKIKMEMESPKEQYMDGKLEGSEKSSDPQVDVKVKDEPDVKDIKSESQKLRLLNHAQELKEEKLSDSLTLPTPSSISPQKGDNSHGNAPRDGTSPSSQNGEHLRPTPEKRERDESWKSYLIRYTANDPCNSRCQYLYKDHYHCRVEGCQVLFRSKDGVREHAKFHEIQDRITPLVYVVHEDHQACPQNCQYSLKQKHYHCNWTGCSHAIPHVGPAFARLEHYRIHEYAKASAGKGKFGNSKDDEFSKRRRGRPPKYPRTEIPNVPKVELPDSIIQESVRQYAEGKFDPSADVINGFKRFTSEEACPDPQCIHYMKDHFHCARPRCHHATDRMDVLNLHAKDFHNFVTILEGFEFFDRNVDCRRPHCHNNRANRHFHCLKPKCDYSFVRHSTMVQHDRKHKMPPAPKLAPVPIPKKDTSSFIPIVPAMPSMAFDAKNKNIVKAAGTFYPMSPLSDIQVTGPNAVFTQPLSVAMANSLTTQSLSAVMANTSLSMISQPLQSTITALPSNMATFMPIMAGGQLQVPMSQALPLTMLLQQKGQSLPQPSWTQIRSKMHVAVNQNCGRPFCKLKKKDHYHCMECNQAFSDPARLRCHMGKHGFKFKRTDSASKPVQLFPKPSSSVGLDLSNSSEAVEEEEFEDDKNSEDSDPQDGEYEVSASSSLNLNPETFANILQSRQNLVSEENSNEEEEEEEFEDEEREEEMSDTNGNDEDEASRDETTNGNGSYNYEDDSLDDRPLIVDESQDSIEEHGEEESVGLNLSLSRRSGRKRTATKHDDFIDSDVLMAKQRKISSTQNPKDQLAVPEGFARYRAGEECGHSYCSYKQSGTHYHCTREDCYYGFSDRTRFIQHLMRHERLDNIMGREFYHYRSSVSCGRGDCELSIKSSHFHCMKCPFACADSSKVPAHRKYHTKMESIASNGFQKFTGSEDCKIVMCTYYKKQTHYHCTYPGCNHAVLGPAQMAAHKVKHPQEDLN